MHFGLSSLFYESRKGEGWEIGSIIRKTPAAYVILKIMQPKRPKGSGRRRGAFSPPHSRRNQCLMILRLRRSPPRPPGLGFSRPLGSTFFQRAKVLQKEIYSLESNLLIILGPTASGKTRVGVQVAKVLGGEIISADSRQVYRGMDIGTGKDLGEYGTVPYHLVDIVEPGHEFNVFEFHRRFGEAFTDIRARGRLPILGGGTGMYLDAVLRGYRLAEAPEKPALRRELLPLTLEELAARLKKYSPSLPNN